MMQKIQNEMVILKIKGLVEEIGMEIDWFWDTFMLNEKKIVSLFII